MKYGLHWDLEEFESKFLPDHQGGHSSFQIENFMIGTNRQTIYAQYKQCLRELLSRYHALKETYRDTTAREFKVLMECARKIKEEIGTLDPKTRKRLEIESWVHQFKYMACLDLLTIGQLSKPTAEMLLSFPANMRLSLLEETRDKDKLILEVTK